MSDLGAELRETARAYAEKELRPHVREWLASGSGLPARHHRQMAELGWCGMCLPEEYGGGGVDLAAALGVLEELARVAPMCAGPVFETNVGPVRVIERHGSAAQRERWLPRVANGAMISVSMSEPAAGSALTDLRTRARAVGDGRFALSGEKAFCTGAGHADAYLVYARLGEAQGAPGIGAVLLEAGRPGLGFGPPEQYLGLQGMPGGSVFLDGVEFTAEDVVVPAGGFARLMGTFNIERLGNATMSLAVASAALADSLAYAQERHAFGRPIVEFQAVQHLLAEMHMRCEAARLLIRRAAEGAGHGEPSVLDASTAKCYANQAAKEVCDMAMQVFAGHGYTTSHDVERYLRDAYGWATAGGTLQVQRTTIAAALAGRSFSQRAKG